MDAKCASQIEEFENLSNKHTHAVVCINAVDRQFLQFWSTGRSAASNGPEAAHRADPEKSTLLAAAMLKKSVSLDVRCGAFSFPNTMKLTRLEANGCRPL